MSKPDKVELALLLLTMGILAAVLFLSILSFKSGSRASPPQTDMPVVYLL